MMHVPPRSGLRRLPAWVAGFVVLVCVAILGLSGWQEWSAREDRLKDAETEMGDLARSLIQHAEDSLDLIDSGSSAGSRWVAPVLSRFRSSRTSWMRVSSLSTASTVSRSSMSMVAHMDMNQGRTRLVGRVGRLDLLRGQHGRRRIILLAGNGARDCNGHDDRAHDEPPSTLVAPTDWQHGAVM